MGSLKLVNDQPIFDQLLDLLRVNDIWDWTSFTGVQPDLLATAEDSEEKSLLRPEYNHDCGPGL